MKKTKFYSLSILLVLSSLSLATFAYDSGTSIRVITANLSSGSKQSYDPGEGARILKGLKPDVVMIQEFNYKTNTPEDIREFVSTTFGKEFSYYRESEASDNIPNGVISRFPILESGEWTDAMMPNRDFAYARMDIPGDRDLWAISVHLHSKKTDVRRYEAEELVKHIREIPEKDYVVLGGDFNLTSRQDEIIGILSAVVSERAAPVDPVGNTTTNMNGKKNYDWVLADSDLETHQVPVGLLSSAVSGLVFDSTTFPDLSLVPGVEKSDSRAPGMQHLPVVKDFRVPAPESTSEEPAPAPTPSANPAPAPSQMPAPGPSPIVPVKPAPIPASTKKSIWPAWYSWNFFSN